MRYQAVYVLSAHCEHMKDMGIQESVHFNIPRLEHQMQSLVLTDAMANMPYMHAFPALKQCVMYKHMHR